MPTGTKGEADHGEAFNTVQSAPRAAEKKNQDQETVLRARALTWGSGILEPMPSSATDFLRDLGRVT